MPYSLLLAFAWATIFEPQIQGRFCANMHFRRDDVL
jgi:hypothetical protein